MRSGMTTALQDLARRFAGSWTTEATHPLVPGEVIHGTSQVEAMPGERFLVHRTQFDHPDFPDALAVLGDTAMHYFDVRGVHRLFALTMSPDGWSIVRDRGDEAFAQRMAFVFDGADVLRGTTQLCRDGSTWEEDLAIVYRRVPA